MMKSLKDIIKSYFQKDGPIATNNPTTDQTVILPSDIESELSESEKNIVLSNLELLTSTKPGGLGPSFLSESMGGNAGSWKGNTCQGHNFAYTNEGEIKYISTEYNCPEEFKGLPRSAYKIACNFHPEDNDFRIVEMLEPERMRFIARRMIFKTMNAYNEVYGFTPKE